MQTVSKLKLVSWGVILLFVGFVFYISMISFWTSDAPYFALKFEMDGSDPHQKIDGFGTLLASQQAHYMTWSGRFFCQSIVQIFCGLTERPVFELCNAVVSLVFILSALSLAKIKLDEPLRVFMVSAVMYLILASLPFDPPFLINYLWMGTVILLWLNLFSIGKRRSFPALAALFLFSVIAGNSQEAFSVPLAGALAVWILLRRFKLDTVKWVLAVGFFIGALLVVGAPGNYERLGEVNGENSSVLKNIWIGLPMAAVALFLILVGRKNIKPLTSLQSPAYMLMIGAVPFTLLFAVVLKFVSFPRLLVPANIFLTLIAFGFGSKIRKPGLLAAIVAIACVITGVCERRLALSNYAKYSLITKLYHESADGIIVIPDAMACKDDGKSFCYDSGWVVAERADNPGKPYLKKYPESLLKLKIESDTTIIEKIAPQAWIIVNSLDKPKNVVVKKRLLPGVLDMALPDRLIDFSDYPELVIDTIANNVAGLYINHRPYMTSQVVVEEP